MAPKGGKKKAAATVTATISSSEGSQTPTSSLGNINRNVTGVLTSHPQSRDIKVEAFSLQNYGVELITETTLELNYGLRYGLLGLNGCGKSTLMEAIGCGEVPIPKHMVRACDRAGDGLLWVTVTVGGAC